METTMARNDTGESTAAIVLLLSLATPERVTGRGRWVDTHLYVRSRYCGCVMPVRGGQWSLYVDGNPYPLVRRNEFDARAALIELVGADTYALTERGRNADVS